MRSARDGPALRLSDRTVGAQFCTIERALLFGPEFKNVGWAHFLTPETLVLRRSKFTDLDRGITYLLPPDLSRRVDEGDLVSIEGKAERKVGKDPAGKGASAFISREYVLAQDVREARLPAITPGIPRDEFLQRAGAGWRYADLDMLDTVIALQLVSAPPSVYGRGGIGSEGLESFRERGMGTPLDVVTTILDQLPVEFRTGSPVYRFEALDTLPAFRSFRKVKAQEANFSIVRPHRVTDAWAREKLPIQLPFVLKEAIWKGEREELDLDVLEYQLCALYSPTPPAEDILPLAVSTIRKAHASELFDFPSLVEIDTLSGVRVALSMMRLNIGRELKGGRYMRRPLSGPEEGLKVLEEILKRGLEEVRRKANDENLFRRDRSLPFRDRLTQNDREIYSRIRRIVEEEGLTDVPLSRIIQPRGQAAAESSLANLNKYGYVLFMKGGTSLRIVDLDSI